MNFIYLKGLSYKCVIRTTLQKEITDKIYKGNKFIEEGHGVSCPLYPEELEKYHT